MAIVKHNFTVQQYIDALNKIKDIIKEEHLHILEYQFFSPNKSLTSTQLAKKFGYKSYNYANLQYGKIGHFVADALNYHPQRSKSGRYSWWSIISKGIDRTNEHDFIWVMYDNFAKAIEEVKLFKDLIYISPDEINDDEQLINLTEGSVREIKVNAYERNLNARRICIDYYGTRCIICNFDFKNKYGEIGKDYIHVHHIIPLSTINEEYEIDPIKDLRPVCPNCHAIIHKKKPPYLIEELKEIIRNENDENQNNENKN